MTTFDVYLNGRKKCTAGIRKAGVVVSAITWASHGIPSDPDSLELRVSGLVSRTRTHVDWFHRPLKTGDEVKIRIGEGRRVDRPKRKRRESPAARLAREKHYLEQRAAKLGLRLVK